MTLPEYVHNHLIDLDLMSKSELTDLIDSVYDQVDIAQGQTTELLDLLSDLQDHLYSDDVAWITRYKYHNS